MLAIAISLPLSFASSADPLRDVKDGMDWAGYGRTYDETHYSPLADLDTSNVSHLGLVWWADIPGIVQATSVPLEVDGKLYFATGYSVVHAVDAASGRPLWTYDPHVPEVAGRKLRIPWAIRGIAFWDKKVYVGTHDGRLICIDADSGKAIWTVLTTEPGDRRVITGPPLAFNGRILMGHGKDYGSGDAPIRGYVTAYDARTGKRLWRFYTVPGDPSKGFESPVLERAAATWHGDWWKAGGGGNVWNAMTYDPELNLIYIGVGNGVPNDAVTRSPGGGDNLFLASIVALNADTGAYVWHYQLNPAETWDYDATNDIELADLTIGGARRRVLLHAAKNGFFYVLDRATGQLISAEKFATVTWATRIDLATGRPIETPNARDPNLLIWPPNLQIWPNIGAHGPLRMVWPNIGAHGLQPMAFSPKRDLVYIPVIDRAPEHPTDNDSVDEHEWWRREASGSLLAWNPVAQREAWRVPLPGLWNGGVEVTAGNLVFEGGTDGRFVAYAADSGKQLWSFDAQVAIVGAPITYKVADRQYIAVMAGVGGVGAMMESTWDARTISRRVLAFALDGGAKLPPAPLPAGITPVADSTYKTDTRLERAGGVQYVINACDHCHGADSIAGGAGPDLRASPVILSSAAFRRIVKDGALLEQGMPRFDDLSDADLEGIRQYVRARAMALRTAKSLTDRAGR